MRKTLGVQGETDWNEIIVWAIFSAQLFMYNSVAI